MALFEPSLTKKPELRLLAMRDDGTTSKLVLPPLSNDLQRVLLTHLDDVDVLRLGAVSWSFYRLTRHDDLVWQPRIRALAQTLTRRWEAFANERNRDVIAQCASTEHQRLLHGVSGFLALQSAAYYCEGRMVHKALFDFAATHEGQMSLSEGMLINVLEQDPSGWCEAIDESTRTIGYVPINFTMPYGRVPLVACALRLQKLLAIAREPVDSAKTEADNQIPHIREEPLLTAKPALKLLAFDAAHLQALPLLPPHLQRRVLRFLSDSEVVRLGLVSRAFYSLTRRVAEVWAGPVMEIGQRLLTKAARRENRDELEWCQDGWCASRGFVGFLQLQSLALHCEGRVSWKPAFDFAATSDEELSLVEGRTVLVLIESPSGWWFCRDESGKEGWAPSNYLERCGGDLAKKVASLRLQALLTGTEAATAALSAAIAAKADAEAAALLKVRKAFAAVDKLLQPSLTKKPALQLLTIGDETPKLALPLTPDVQRLLLSDLSDREVVRLGAVCRSFYRLTRRDPAVWDSRIRALAQTVAPRRPALSPESAEIVRQCARAGCRPSLEGFVGFLTLQSARFYCSSLRVQTAMYDYEPSGPEELRLAAGAEVVVLHETPGGWWRGLDERIGTVALFPSNYTVCTKHELPSASALCLQSLLAIVNVDTLVEVQDAAPGRHTLAMELQRQLVTRLAGGT
jgi:hypothetical protein